MKKKNTIFDAIVFIVSCILAIFWMVLALLNLWIGIDTHEVYYPVSAIIYYYFMQSNLKDIKKYIDIED